MEWTYAFLLLCTVGLVIEAGDTKTVAAVDEQIESVKCDGTGRITGTLKTDTWVKQVSVKCKNVSGNVSYTQPGKENPTTFAIIGCTEDSPITITLSNTTKNATVLVGKVQIVNVTCNGLTSAITMTPHLIFTEAPINTEAPKTVVETIALSMMLTAFDTSKTEVTTISIGSNYSLYIGGAETHGLRVDSCSVASNDNFNRSVQVYPNKTNATSTKVLETFESLTSSQESPVTMPDESHAQLRAILHGFRLVGSNTVYLKCVVTVFPNTPSSARKRKGRKHLSAKHEAVLRFHVRDKIFETSANSAMRMTGGITLKAMVLIAAARLLNHL